MERGYTLRNSESPGPATFWTISLLSECMRNEELPRGNGTCIDLREIRVASRKIYTYMSLTNLPLGFTLPQGSGPLDFFYSIRLYFTHMAHPRYNFHTVLTISLNLQFPHTKFTLHQLASILPHFSWYWFLPLALLGFILCRLSPLVPQNLIVYVVSYLRRWKWL